MLEETYNVFGLHQGINMASNILFPGYGQYISLDKRSKAFVDDIPFEKLPLYVNDSRYFVKEFVLERLKGKTKESK